MEILTGAARPILDRWFESEQLKGTLATDAVIGALASPSMPGTAYVLFHHVMGESGGKRGIWAYVRGGMGGLTQALGRGRVATSAPRSATRRWRVSSCGAGCGRGAGHGDEFHAPIVASNADANVTFLRLLDPSPAAEAFVAEIERISYASASLKINVALAELPSFRALPGSDQPRNIAARSTSARTRTTSSAPSTMPSTAAPRRSPCSSARSRRPSTRRSRRPAVT